ncbi:bifunctional methylenetetrahydrofolate dehydrogenase/methenyltetrahydrofolate cyclohydrolase FolD [Sporolactobacillus sp. CQH2019]|uniref:bifunctional methylenetetrahydrofolate dehydrogenase/methenyltetrahydrofolate cyclohydrolase FolD n=1 Tax=Sporolactobacillus sp. CQH2019 TaxID=3023512 RepID=UPI002367A4A8|nr:bifunctional methylenetetrahydrofolate dehydrogenase/methenyltetrahydrofolate cyclohydrolase FolD [Sporolactobacillus sp. CQH2019]MDD9149302.1 bifunctional methylenetetrahydrofolate dehydrogenase/methenyltetrahydrofolate cyclohydrolase FolD [Sporolactobacillus sp. CQH2019]
MTAQLINGKEIARAKRLAMKAAVGKMKSEGAVPGLAVVLVGENPASQSYVKGKIRDCKEVGIYSELIHFPESVSEKALLDKIRELNEKASVHGILVQLPLPKQISEQKVIQTISPAKDVDGFHPINLGRMMTGQSSFVPCTPAGIIEMLHAVNVQIAGKHVVIVGRSNIVGKPAALLFLNNNATVTLCHSKTTPLSQYTKQADVLVVAVGHAGLIGAEDIKPGAIVIDVGMNRNADGKLAGDVEFEEVREKASFITPVPGGVGPMTRVMLLENTLKAANHFIKERDLHAE